MLLVVVCPIILLEKEKARRPVKWNRAELEEMLADYQARIKVELERVEG